MRRLVIGLLVGALAAPAWATPTETPTGTATATPTTPATVNVDQLRALERGTLQSLEQLRAAELEQQGILKATRYLLDQAAAGTPPTP